MADSGKALTGAKDFLNSASAPGCDPDPDMGHTVSPVPARAVLYPVAVVYPKSIPTPRKVRMSCSARELGLFSDTDQGSC